MTVGAPTRHPHLPLLVLLAAIGAWGCKPCQPASFVDLLQALPAAEQRSQFPRSDAIVIVNAGQHSARQSLRTCGATRIIWSLCLPRNAVLRTAVAFDPADSAPGTAIAVRIGVSNERRYDLLFRQELLPPEKGGDLRWTPVNLRLSRYTDWQWSLFYRPWELTWKVIFSSDAAPVGGRAACGYWETPRLEADDSNSWPPAQPIS